MTNLDITSYNIGELLQFADIYNKRIEDVSEDEIKKGIDARIIRSMQLNKPKITEFFQAVREKLLESLDFVDKVIPERNWEQKINDIKENNIDFFVMGSDWEGKFDNLNQYCKIIYFPRTKGISTSKLKSILKD